MCSESGEMGCFEKRSVLVVPVTMTHVLCLSALPDYLIGQILNSRDFDIRELVMYVFAQNSLF